MRLLKTVFLLVPAVVATGWLAVGQQPREVDDAALAPGGTNGDEWVSYNVNWFEQRYSPLDQINESNVQDLGLAWSYDIPRASGNPQNRQEATHLVHNGVLYSISPWSVVYAVDVRTGQEVWHRDPEVDQSVWQSRICCGVVNRGIALYEGKVIAPVVDGRLTALDAETGQLLWEVRVSPEDEPYTLTMSPRIIKGGRIIVGLSGGEYGVRGFFAAHDVNTGEQLWRFYTVPANPADGPQDPVMEMAAATWAPEFWDLGLGGGAPVWNGMAYDPEVDLVYVGTGQPAPWTSEHRGLGDNLFSSSILAVRGATGEYVWHYQPTPGDDWDYDSIADIMLVDMEIDGRMRHLLLHAPKNGFFYVLDRRTGELLSAEPWVRVSWAAGINMRTGRPLVNPEARYANESVRVMPGPGGGHVWPPWSYHPETGLVYIPSTIGGSYTYRAADEFTVNPGGFNMGTGGGGGGGRGRGGRGRGGGDVTPGLDPNNPEVAGRGRGGPPPTPQPAPQPAFALPEIGPTGNGNILSAWDPITQTERWRVQGGSAGFNSGGTLATGGNLVFSVVNTRLLAFRADNGAQLLDLPLGLSQAGPPMTFMIDGTQYLMVAGGPPGGGGRGGFGGFGRGAAEEDTGPPPPSRLVALVLDGETPLPGVEED